MKQKLMYLFMLLFMTSCYSQKITVITKEGNAKDESVIYKDGVLILDHIAQKIEDINIPKNIKIKNVYFSFVDLSQVSDSFWQKFSDIEVLVFVFIKLGDLDFLKYLKNVKVISFEEPYRIDKYKFDLSNNQKLEYLKIQNLDGTEISFDGKYCDKLKYIVLNSFYGNDVDYEKIQQYFGKKMIYILNENQIKYFKNYKYSLTEIQNLEEEYQITRKF